jgi:hypothetical protein
MTCWWSTRRSRRTRAAASCRSMPSWTFCGLCGRRTPPSREARRRQVMWPASAADRRLCRSRAMTCLGLVRLLVAATTCSLVRLLATLRWRVGDRRRVLGLGRLLAASAATARPLFHLRRLALRPRPTSIWSSSVAARRLQCACARARRRPTRRFALASARPAASVARVSPNRAVRCAWQRLVRKRRSLLSLTVTLTRPLTHHSSH